MLPTKYRLTKEKDFKRVNASGKSFFSPYFRLRFAPNNLDFSRFAVVVSNKVSKKAVERNRLKRQFKDILRLARLKIKPGFDIVFFIKDSSLNKDYDQFLGAVTKILEKAELLK